MPFHSPCTATWAPKPPQNTGATAYNASKQGLVSLLRSGWLGTAGILGHLGKETAP